MKQKRPHTREAVEFRCCTCRSVAIVTFAAVFSSPLIIPTATRTGVLAVRRLVVTLAHFWTTVILRSRRVVRLSTTIAAIILARRRAIHIMRGRVRNITIHAAIAWPILRFRTGRSHVASMKFVRT